MEMIGLSSLQQWPQQMTEGCRGCLGASGKLDFSGSPTTLPSCFCCVHQLGASFTTYRKESVGTWSMPFIKSITLIKQICPVLWEDIKTWLVVLGVMEMHWTTAAEAVVITGTEQLCSICENRGSRSWNCIYTAGVLVVFSHSDPNQAGLPRKMKMRH